MRILKVQFHNNADSVVTDNIYYISFSRTTQHSHLAWTTFMDQELRSKLKKEIKVLVNNGITNIQTSKVLLKELVKKNVGDNVSNSSRASKEKDHSKLSFEISLR